MPHSLSIRLLDFLLTLSESLDLFSSLLAQHQLRTAFIAMRLGEKMRLSPTVMEPVLVGAFLHDIGALTIEEKVALHENDYERDMDVHCILGEKLLSRSPMFEYPGKIVRYHHTGWQRFDLSNLTTHTLQSQILFLADLIERSIVRKTYILHQDEKITARIASLSGTDIHPDLVDAFHSMASAESFWLDLVSPFMLDMLREEASGRDTMIQQSAFLTISEFVRAVIDFKSPFTATHSTGVSTAASLLASFYGFSGIEIEMMKMVGNVHDLGKLAVPSSILEKTAGFTKREFAIMRQHTYYTHSILSRCGLPATFVEWAAFHHERLNGKGYPFHVDASRIDIGARVVAAADILVALLEDRPYRKGMSRKQAIAIIDGLVAANHLDAAVVAVLKRYCDDIVEPTRQRQKTAIEEYRERLNVA